MQIFEKYIKDVVGRAIADKAPEVIFNLLRARWWNKEGYESFLKVEFAALPAWDFCGAWFSGYEAKGINAD
jgi:hypothetical protein